MICNLLEKIKIGVEDGGKSYFMPEDIRNILITSTNYFNRSSNNKLCIVFPSKDYATHWLSIPLIIQQIKKDYLTYSNNIYDSSKYYKKGDRLILNNDAIVEWSRAEKGLIYFKYLPTIHSDEIGISIKNISKLQPAPPSRHALSSYKRVKQALFSATDSAIDNLLEIKTDRNRQFQENFVCMVSKYRSCHEALSGLALNSVPIGDYFRSGKINENGDLSEKAPLLITNNFSNLVLFLAEGLPPSEILIDGFHMMVPRGDFSSVDQQFNVPTILITDLSEIDSFEEIKNSGYEFLSYNVDNNVIIQQNNDSPFFIHNIKFNNCINFKFHVQKCSNSDIDSLITILHSFPNIENNDDYDKIRISLIKIANLLSRICYHPDSKDLSLFNEEVSRIEILFDNNQLWLGDARSPIAEALKLIKKYFQHVVLEKTEKCVLFERLVNTSYDYIICANENEAITLRRHLNSTTKVISIDDINDLLLPTKAGSALLTGWPKGHQLNKLMTSFIFNEITALFYQHESGYYSSLQRRNINAVNNIKSADDEGSQDGKSKAYFPRIFENVFSNSSDRSDLFVPTFDIIMHETQIDNTQYSKYLGIGNLVESCKARRIDFENNTFIYATESHKFLVINELFEIKNKKGNIYNRQFDALRRSDIIAFINTDRDVLIELIEKTTDLRELESINKWINLWKSLLKGYYASIDYNFTKLVADLHHYGCTKIPPTIKSWLDDEGKIGPDDDNDLRCIALLANSEELHENIETARKAISRMTSLRMRVAELVREKIKLQLQNMVNKIIGNSIEIPELGIVELLKIVKLNATIEEIDKRYINRLIHKEIV